MFRFYSLGCKASHKQLTFADHPNKWCSTIAAVFISADYSLLGVEMSVSCSHGDKNDSITESLGMLVVVLGLTFGEAGRSRCPRTYSVSHIA